MKIHNGNIFGIGTSIKSKFLKRGIESIAYLLIMMAISLTSAFAFEIAFIQPNGPIEIGSDSKNNSFPLTLSIRNSDGLSDAKTGFKDFILYINQYDITDFFLSSLKVKQTEEDPSIALDVTSSIPSGLLKEGVYFLNAAVRDKSDEIFTATLHLVIGRPSIVSPTPGNAKELRSLVEDANNRIIHIPAGRYDLKDNTVLRLKRGQIVFGDGPDQTELNGAGITISGLSPVLVLGPGTSLCSLSIRGNPVGSGVSLDQHVSAFLGNICSSDNKGGGVVAYDRSDIQIVNGKFSNNACDGVTAGRNSTATVIMSLAYQNSFDGFGAEKSSSLKVDFSKAQDNHGVGIGIFTESNGKFMRNFICDNHKAGIFVGHGCLAETIFNNRIVGNTEDGVGILGPDTAVKSMEANRFEGNRSGVTINSSGIVKDMVSNSFIDNKNSNLSVLNGSSVVMRSNSFAASINSIGVDGQGSYLNSLNDIIKGALNLGILVQNQAEALFTGTSSKFNKGGGLSVTLGAQVWCDRVDTSENMGFGIGVNDAGTRVTVSNSTIHNNNNYGIIYFESHGASLSIDDLTDVSGNSPANIGRF